MVRQASSLLVEAAPADAGGQEICYHIWKTLSREDEVDEMSQMTIGCALWTLGPTPTVSALAQQMEVAAETGCTSVQPWIVNVEYDPCILDPEVGSAADRREVVKIAASLGLSFSGFCQLQGAVTWGGLEA